jgi:peptide/nickel transport system permease protein
VPRWLRNRPLVAGLLIIGTIVGLAAAAPLLTPYDPAHQDVVNVLQPISWRHPLGTDDLGRDVWAQLLYGARIDLRTAFLAVLFPFVIGTALGLVAGYFGGIVDSLVTWATNVVFAFPFYVLIIALVFALGAGARAIYIAITIVGWVSYARIVRGQVLVAKQQEYVHAARVAGLSTPRILLRHLLPNVLTQAVVFSMSDVVLDILAIVALGYLGLGIQPPTASWGSLLSEAPFFYTTQPWLMVWPGLVVLLTTLAFNLLGDGLHDALNPRVGKGTRRQK